MRSQGGVHDLQILSLENVIEFSQDPGSELVGFGRNLVEIVPRSLPELFKQLGDQNNSQKHQKNEIQNFKKSKFQNGGFQTCGGEPGEDFDP